MWTIIFFTSWQCSSLWWAMMIGWVIWVMKVNQNVKKVPLIIKKWKTHFYITFNFWWLAKWSKQQKSTEMQKKTQVIKKWNAWFWITFNFWWSAKWSEWWTLTETKKRPPNSLKNKMLIFGCSISDDWLSNLSDERRPKCKKRKKGPWCHRKLKWSFLDYVQLLMIGQVINKSWLKCKKKPLSHQKMECLVLDYIQLLMISRAIWARNVNWNAKKKK